MKILNGLLSIQWDLSKKVKGFRCELLLKEKETTAHYSCMDAVCRPLKGCNDYVNNSSISSTDFIHFSGYF